MRIPIRLQASVRLGASLALLLIAGCASNNPWENYHFGGAVRHQIAIQTANPGASAYGLDGVKAAGALSAYQKDQGDPKSVKTFDLVTPNTPGEQ
jgi:membrane-associated PAP2 superfamily phosphatase